MAAELAMSIISILFGLAVLIFPKFLRFIIGFYFLFIGLLGLAVWLL